jgi:hypothetical protein
MAQSSDRITLLNEQRTPLFLRLMVTSSLAALASCLTGTLISRLEATTGGVTTLGRDVALCTRDSLALLS